MEDLRNIIKEYLLQSVDLFDLAGLACGVSVGENSSLACAGLDEEFACGYANFEQKIPLAAGEVFHFASISKLFVSSAVCKLAGEGQMDLDARLTQYLPDFEMADERYRDITIRHILSHTSGIPDIADYHWQSPKTDNRALYNYAHSDEVRSLKLLWAPGSRNFKYSNIAFDVLGAAIEVVTGKSFEMYMADFFFIPLGMTNTTFFTPLRLQKMDTFAPCIVRPHFKDAQNHIQVQSYYPYNREHAPSSTLTSILRDIKKWGDVCNAEELSRDEAFQPHADIPISNEQIGLGWFIREQNGYTLYGHEGADDGFRSSFWICPELHLQITVLANLDRSPVKKINKKVFDFLTTDHTSSASA